MNQLDVLPEWIEKNEIICFSGDVAKQSYIIAKGRIRLLKHILTGRELLLDLLTPGEFYGMLSGVINDAYPESE